jgi:hypothetical protein
MVPRDGLSAPLAVLETCLLGPGLSLLQKPVPSGCHKEKSGTEAKPPSHTPSTILRQLDWISFPSLSPTLFTRGQTLDRLAALDKFIDWPTVTSVHPQQVAAITCDPPFHCPHRPEEQTVWQIGKRHIYFKKRFYIIYIRTHYKYM